MTFAHGNTSSVHSDSAKKEQIITEFFPKSLHIILEARAPYMSSRNYSGEQLITSPSPSSSSSSSSSYRSRDKWFNLALRECPAALENIDFWRQSNLDPMIVDVILVQCPVYSESEKNSAKGDNCSEKLCLTQQNPSRLNLEQENYVSGPKREKVIERWVVVYESKKSTESSSKSKRSSGNLPSIYKKSILLLRSLYATVRLLPAYKLFRDLISSGQIRNYTLTHRVSSFVEPFTRNEEADMRRFAFTPVDTSCGRLCISVLYQSSLLNLSSELSASIAPQFIPDYVGSPLADPLRRFPSMPVSHSSPPYSPFSRRHSWSYDAYHASPPSGLPSPSPTYSDSNAHIGKNSVQKKPPVVLPHHLPGSTQANINSAGYDEYLPSPASPSPPMYSHPTPSLLRCESAPVRIPITGGLGSALVSSSKQDLPPSPPLSGRRYVLKIDKQSSGQFLPAKDESGRFSGLRLSANSSPQFSISRSSSKISYQDDYDCPFAEVYDDMIDQDSRGSFDSTRHSSEPSELGSFPAVVPKSENAELGALVLMLQKAPPLNQTAAAAAASRTNPATAGPSTATISSTAPTTSKECSQEPGITYSSIAAACKTTSDALAELREHRKVKEKLMKQGSEKK